MIVYTKHLFKVDSQASEKGNVVTIETDNAFHAIDLINVDAMSFSVEDGMEPYQKLLLIVNGSTIEFRHRTETGFNPMVKTGFQKLFKQRFNAALR